VHYLDIAVQLELEFLSAQKVASCQYIQAQ